MGTSYSRSVVASEHGRTANGFAEPDPRAAGIFSTVFRQGGARMRALRDIRDGLRQPERLTDSELLIVPKFLADPKLLSDPMLLADAVARAIEKHGREAHLARVDVVNLEPL